MTYSKEHYLNLSMNGKWISLGRDWIRDNGPCTIGEYFVGVRPLMPTHICFKGKKATQFQLARAVLVRLKIKGEIVALEESK